MSGRSRVRAIHVTLALSLAVMAVSALRFREGPEGASRLTKSSRAAGQRGVLRAPAQETWGTLLMDSEDPRCGALGAVGSGLRPVGSFLLRSTEDGETWVLDPSEIRGLEDQRDAHCPHLLLSPAEDGGVRVSHRPEDSRVGIARGLREGDVVRGINGIPVRDEHHFRLLAGRLWAKAPALRVMLEREGRPMAIAFKRSAGSVESAP